MVAAGTRRHAPLLIAVLVAILGILPACAYAAPLSPDSASPHSSQGCGDPYDADSCDLHAEMHPDATSATAAQPELSLAVIVEAPTPSPTLHFDTIPSFIARTSCAGPPDILRI